MAVIVRLTPGSEPEVEIHEPNLTQLDITLRSFREQGVWSSLKGAAREFADAPMAGVETVQAVIPGAEVISDEAIEPVKPQPQDSLAGQSTPACRTCGQATRFASGTGKNGPWSGYFCASGDRTHTTFLNK